MNTIEVQDLSKRFGKFTAVDSVSFAVKKGEVFGFLGANGAGKSTTIRMLCGILAPSSGDALVNGYSIMKQPDEVKRNIGYMSQRFSLYNDLTVSENINFYGGVYGLHGDKLSERKKWVLKISNLEGKEDILTSSLPGGIKQRLALGTAVIHRPGIVFLDEPTSGVDPISRRSFWALINELSQEGTTILVTTHYLEEAEFCNNIILINAGRLIAEGNPGQLKSGFLKNPIYEIECSNVVEAMEIMEKIPYAGDITIFGSYVHLSTDESISPERISSDLRLQGIEVTRIDRITPTLEDVFISLLERDKNA